MKSAKINFTIVKPEDVTDEDFMEWLHFELGVRGNIRVENQLEYAELRGMVLMPTIQKIG